MARADCNSSARPRPGPSANVVWATLLALLFVSGASAGEFSAPAFDKAFSPNTIGPGSVSMLVFTVENFDSDPVEQLAFTDTLPADMTLAEPTLVSNTCGGTLTFSGGDTITLAGGGVGADTVCTIIVNVTAVAVDASDTSYTNTSGDLTSDAGNSGPATDDLMVDIDRPGFSKSFAPSTVEFGGRSTLTFTIDNTLNGASASPLGFSDPLPAGMVVAGPSEAATDCDFDASPIVTAVPGTGIVSLLGGGVAAGEGCIVSVDVIGAAVGSLGNVSGELIDADPFGSDISSGKAAAVLEVTSSNTLVELAKEFIDDPVAPGGTVTLEFTVTNKSRDDSATGITFSDTIDPMGSLTGVTPTLPPTPDPPCGAGSSLAFSLGALTLTGGTLPPEGSCTFSVSLSVPVAAVPGTYPNTAGPVSGNVGGSPETGNSASDSLFVVASPILTKEFIDDPVGAGGSVTLRFTITNTNSASPLTGIDFTDDLNAAVPSPGSIPGLAANSLVAGDVEDPVFDVCGMGSVLTVLDPPDIMIGMITFVIPADPTMLIFSGGSLAAAGMPGDSCSFDVVLDVGEGVSGLVYVNTSSEVTGLFSGAVPTTGNPASGDLVVIGAPRLNKEFTDDPVAPGDTVTLEFTLTHIPPGLPPLPDATAIAFSDDLGATLAGLTLTSVSTNTCGGAVGGIGTDMFSYSGGTLTAGTNCTIAVELTTPGSPAGGIFSNSTSTVSATVDGVATAGAPAKDDLIVSGFIISKEFIGDPVIAGGPVTLSFTLDNTVGTVDATSIAFEDGLNPDVLPGLTATLPPLPDPPCGGTLTVANLGPPNIESLVFSGGSVAAGMSCSFSVTLTVPAGTPDGTYGNVTSSSTATIGTPFVPLPPAVDDLIVDSTLLEITKEFTDDPVEPGDTVTLEFTLTNLSATETATDIAFDDDLAAALPGLMATGATVNDCGGMASGFPTGLFSYAGGSLLPGASCMIVLDVDVPMGPLSGNLFPNTTTGIAGKVGALDVFGSPASDDLEVQLLKLSKSFDGPSTATGTAILTFTIENLDSTNAASNLSFSDDLDAALSGLTATSPPTPDPPCGTGSVLTGTSFLALSDASLPAGGMCSFDVTVTVPASATAGTFVNNTSNLFQFGLPLADPATALLTVEPPPTFAKLFAPDSITEGNTSTLTFTIDNSASALAASALAFTDNLPAGVTVATPPNTSNTCGGTLTAGAGTGVITLTGGSTAAGAGCEITVDVIGVPGVHVNTTLDLTSSSGNSGTASDTLTVTANTPTLTPTTTPTSTSTSTPSSTPTATTTQTPTATLDPNSDTDMDGVIAGVEDACPNGGDGNDDGTPDSAQANVTSLPLPGGNCVTMVSSGGCAQNQNVATFSEADFGDDPVADYPLGLIGFMLPCETADVLLIFHGEDDPTGLFYRKFGPMAPVFGPPVFYNFPAVFGTTTIAGETAVTAMLSLTDGLLGDDTDGTDDLIVEPGGPATAVTMPAPAPVVSRLGLLAVLAALLAVAVCALARRRQPRGLTLH